MGRSIFQSSKEESPLAGSCLGERGWEMSIAL